MKIVNLLHSVARSVKGRGLACRKLSKPARALLGVDIVEGTTTITDLSHKQVAAIVGVSIGYLNAAQRLTPAEREAVRRGLRPLVEPRVPATLPAARERLAAIVNEIGVDATMALLTSNERAAA